MTARTDDLLLRRAVPDDRPQVLALLRACLGWDAASPDEELFAWKHDQNAFGRSPAWVAERDGRILGFRTFMRWQFSGPGGMTSAVRAVDTATHPDARGTGVFRRLTTLAVAELAEEGVGLVFNTPNDQSRPGYLSMGWQVVGALPVAVRPAGLTGLARTARARVPADLWSQPTSVGEPAPEAFSDESAVGRLLDRVPPTDRTALATRRTPAFLRWRYGLPELAYRVVRAGARLEDGLLVVRVRRRGRARELAVCEALLPEPGSARRLLRRALHEAGADYAVALGRPAGTLPVPRMGPVLTARRLTVDPPATVAGWALRLGDVELF